MSMGGLAAGGVAAIMGASVVLAVLAAPDVSARAPVSDDASVAATKPVASASGVPGNGVQYVGDVKRPDQPCEEQTWPYIASHCLKPASGPKPATVRVAVDRADIKASRAGMPSPALAAVTPPPEQNAAPEPAPAIEPAVAQAPPQVPAPAARPAVRDQALRDDARKRARSASKNMRAEARRAYASGVPSDRNPSRVVQQTEAEYEVPGPFGTTRRVVVIRQQSLHHQAAAFNDER